MSRNNTPPRKSYNTALDKLVKHGFVPDQVIVHDNDYYSCLLCDPSRKRDIKHCKRHFTTQLHQNAMNFDSEEEKEEKKTTPAEALWVKLGNPKETYTLEEANILECTLCESRVYTRDYDMRLHCKKIRHQLALAEFTGDKEFMDQYIQSVRKHWTADQQALSIVVDRGNVFWCCLECDPETEYSYTGKQNFVSHIASKHRRTAQKRPREETLADEIYTEIRQDKTFKEELMAEIKADIKRKILEKINY